MEKHSGTNEKFEAFEIPGMGMVRFTRKHSCRTLRSANEWKRKYTNEGFYVRVEKEKSGRIYNVYTRKK